MSLGLLSSQEEDGLKKLAAEQADTIRALKVELQQSIGRQCLPSQFVFKFKNNYFSRYLTFLFSDSIV